MANSILNIGTINDMWLRRPMWETEPGYGVKFYKDVLSFVGTPHTFWWPNNIVSKRIKLAFANDTKEDEKEMLDFFQVRRGRWGKFWIPEWSTRFSILSRVVSGSGEISVRNDRLNVIAGGYERIMILLHSGDLVVRHITEVVRISEEIERLTLETGVDRTIEVADIALACFFLLVRFDNDKLPVRYVTDSVSSATFDLFELVREYPV